MKRYVSLFEKDIDPKLQDDLKYWGLNKVLHKDTILAFHGTTAYFKKFDMSKSRTELNNKFYGDGIFFTIDKKVAIKYAQANRNMGFPVSLIDDIKKANKENGLFLEDLYKYGDDAWKLDKYQTENKYGGIGNYPEKANELRDIAEWIVGGKLSPISNDPINIFNQSTGMPTWIYDTLKDVGVDTIKYVPKVYVVELKLDNPLITTKRKEASTAYRKGYDSVILMNDRDLVGGVPEIGVFNTNNIKILKVDKV